MNRILTYIIILIVAAGCSTEERRVYEKLNSLPIQHAIYESNFSNDSTWFYTNSVSVADGNFMVTYVHENNPEDIMRLFEYYEPYMLDEYGDSVLKRTYINYQADTIRGYEQSASGLGTSKTFEINGEKHRVLRQPRWIWTKSQKPNVFEFYTDNYGLILILTRKKKTKLLGFSHQKENPELDLLIEAVQSDKDFYNRKYETVVDNEKINWESNLDTVLDLETPKAHGTFIFFNNDSSVIEERIYKDGELIKTTPIDKLK